MVDVILSLSDKLYEKARQWAAVTHQDLDEALADALKPVLTPLPSVIELDGPHYGTYTPAIAGGSRATAKRIIGWSSRGRALPEEQQELLVLTLTYQRYWRRVHSRLVCSNPITWLYQGARI
jgi:hypothetical protein